MRTDLPRKFEFQMESLDTQDSQILSSSALQLEFN